MSQLSPEEFSPEKITPIDKSEEIISPSEVRDFIKKLLQKKLADLENEHQLSYGSTKEMRGKARSAHLINSEIENIENIIKENSEGKLFNERYLIVVYDLLNELIRGNKKELDKTFSSSKKSMGGDEEDMIASRHPLQEKINKTEKVIYYLKKQNPNKGADIIPFKRN